MEVWDFTPPTENSQAEGEGTPTEMALDSGQQDHSAQEGEGFAQEAEFPAHEQARPAYEQRRPPQQVDEEMSDVESEEVYQERLARMLENESYSTSGESEDMTD